MLGSGCPKPPDIGPDTMHAVEFTRDEAALLGRYFTNLDRPVFALRNLPEVVKGALFSRYSRTGSSPLEKSPRYVRFDRPGADGRRLYYRGPELQHPAYEPAADALFDAYSSLLEPVTESIRGRFPIDAGETERAWKSATRAKAFDLLRGLLPAGTLTNLGLFGNGRAFEYLITKMAAHELPECQGLAVDLHRELAQVIPAF